VGTKDVLRREVGGEFVVRYEEADTNIYGAASIGGRWKLAMSRDGSGNTEYIGKAKMGASKAAALWQIQKLIYTGTDLDDILWADGDTNFDNVWDNRAGLSYS
jgi:hypothetical protein